MCGEPWTSVCVKNNISMSQINVQRGKGWEGDPVFFENVMYSAHLFKMMVLYETISGDVKFSTIGWTFKHKNKQFHYTLDDLYNVIYYQVKKSVVRSFPCEPMMIYAACNSILYSASRLYYKINPRAPTLNFSEFVESLNTVFRRNTTSSIFNQLTNENETDPSIFRAVIMQPALWLETQILETILKVDAEIIDVVNGALGLDAWLIGQAAEAGLKSSLFEEARLNLNSTPAWKFVNSSDREHGMYLNTDVTIAGRTGMTAPLSTAFTLSALGGIDTGRSVSASDTQFVSMHMGGQTNHCTSIRARPPPFCWIGQD